VLDTGMTDKMRNVFLHDETGKEVFTYLLNRLFYFSATEGEVENGLRNLAIELLIDMGVYHEDNQVELVNHLTKLTDRRILE